MCSGGTVAVHLYGGPESSTHSTVRQHTNRHKQFWKTSLQNVMN